MQKYVSKSLKLRKRNVKGRQYSSVFSQMTAIRDAVRAVHFFGAAYGPCPILWVGA
jgi:hypothetical protein